MPDSTEFELIPIIINPIDFDSNLLKNLELF